jgi:hypothetical protein
MQLASGGYFVTVVNYNRKLFIKLVPGLAENNLIPILTRP